MSEHKHILVVDDEADIRELVAGILEDDGYSVRTAHNAEAALLALRARKPALLILDEGPAQWVARQIFDDPAGDHDWGISAVVDLPASDDEGAAVIHVTAVGPA